MLPTLLGEAESDLSPLGDRVERIVVPDSTTPSLLQAIPADIDAVLLLPPLTTNMLMWYRHADAPVLAFTQSETLGNVTARNAVLAHAAAMRPCDTLAVDDDWVAEMVMEVLSHPPAIVTLAPSTSDLAVPRSATRQQFIDRLRPEFPEKRLGSEGFVGVHCGDPWGALSDLATRHADWTILSYDPQAASVARRFANVLHVEVGVADDLVVLSTLVSHLDALVLGDGVGQAAMPKLIAQRAGCPVVRRAPGPDDRALACLRDNIDGELGRQRPSLAVDDPTWEEVAARVVVVLRDAHGRLSSASVSGPVTRR
jgi:hypothetical protein